MTFEDPRSVVNAMDMGPHFIDGCRVDAKRSTRRQPVAPPSEDAESTKRKIFVGGLPKAVGEFELKQYFSRFGNVLGAIHVTEKGSDTRRGFGFVEFDEQAAVDRATVESRHLISGRFVEAKKAVPKEELPKVERRDVRSPRGDGAWRGNPPQGSGARRGKPAAQNVVVPQQQPPFPRLRRGSSGDHRPDYGQNSWGSDPKEQVAKAYPYPPPPRRSSPPRDPRRQAQASAPPHVVGPYGAAEQPPMPYGQETQAFGYGTVNGLQGGRPWEDSNASGRGYRPAEDWTRANTGGVGNNSAPVGGRPGDDSQRINMGSVAPSAPQAGFPWHVSPFAARPPPMQNVYGGYQQPRQAGNFGYVGFGGQAPNNYPGQAFNGFPGDASNGFPGQVNNNNFQGQYLGPMGPMYQSGQAVVPYPVPPRPAYGPGQGMAGNHPAGYGPLGRTRAGASAEQRSGSLRRHREDGIEYDDHIKRYKPSSGNGGNSGRLSPQ